LPRAAVTAFGFRLLRGTNFILLIMAVMKFIPLMMSLSYGLDLAPDQIAKGLGHERAWALDLISDTPYLLTVWLMVGGLLRWQGGQARLIPWQ
jgi:hypothetical protein